ncbi:hypothetical protein [Maricaulis maris]|uniref:hypothetical protein n=1 Tax=Maricaulis maris TaxID=74318 RepID=UPI003A944E2B
MALPRGLKALNAVVYAFCIAAAGGLLAIPATSGWLGLPDLSGGPIALLLALNVLAVGSGSIALRFKFSDNYWPVYAVGTGVVIAIVISAINGGLVWQVIANQRFDRWVVLFLAFPAFALIWLINILSQSEEPKFSSDGLVDEAFEPEPSSPDRIDERPLWRRLLPYFGYVTRMIVVGIVLVQLLAIIAAVAFSFYEVLRLILIENRSISPPAMARLVTGLGQNIGNLYASHAWPLARGTAMYMGLLFGIISIIIVPLGVALGKGERALKARRLTLDEVQKAWVKTSGQAMLDWLEAQPKKTLDSFMMIPVFIVSLMIGPLAAAAGSLLASRAINSRLAINPDELFREMPGGVGVGTTGVVALGVFMLLGLAGSQIIPGIRAYWLSIQRKRLEQQPAIVLLETLAALESAVRHEWFSMSEKFNPGAFYHRWIMRSVNATRTIAVWSLPLVILGTAIDATWFRSWSPDRVTHSPIMMLGTHEHIYRDAVEIQTRCSVQDTNDGPQPRLNYELVFADSHSFSLKTRLVPSDLQDVAQINQAARAGGARLIIDARSDLTQCTALLRGLWGDNGATLARLLSH